MAGSRKLTKTVVVDGTVYVAGTDLPGDVEVDNPKLFEDDAPLSPLEQIEADEKAADERRKAAEDEAKEAEKADDEPAKPARGRAASK